jgi:hypothetical protein
VREKLNANLYRNVKSVKITFRFLHIFIHGSEKIEYIMAPSAPLLEVKKRLDEETKKNFVFYLRESFIPSLDSKVGDVAICYGRKEAEDKYELTLVASENPSEYG